MYAVAQSVGWVLSRAWPSLIPLLGSPRFVSFAFVHCERILFVCSGMRFAQLIVSQLPSVFVGRLRHCTVHILNPHHGQLCISFLAP